MIIAHIPEINTSSDILMILFFLKKGIYTLSADNRDIPVCCGFHMWLLLTDDQVYVNIDKVAYYVRYET